MFNQLRIYIKSRLKLVYDYLFLRFPRLIEAIFTKYPFVYLVKMPCWIHKPQVILVVGSVGKTSTKELIVSLLKLKGNVFYTKQNANELRSVISLLLMGWKKYDYLVIEIGIWVPGNGKSFSRLLSADFIVFTQISPSHIGNFNNSIENIYSEKIQLIDSLKRKGKIIINNDDFLLKRLQYHYKKQIISYGRSESDFKIISTKLSSSGKLSCRLKRRKSILSFKTNLLGEHNAYNIAASVVVAMEYGLTKKQIEQSVNLFESIQHRMKLLKFGNIRFIDDSYNASPASVLAAISTLKNMSSKRRLFVFGDMLELGKNSKKFHRLIAKEIKKTNISKVFLIGKDVKFTREMLLKLSYPQAKINYFNNSDSLLIGLVNNLKQGDLILMKASHNLRLDAFVNKFENGFYLLKKNKRITMPVPTNILFSDGVFGSKQGKQHHIGVDLPAHFDSPVKNIRPGKVIFSNEKNIYGNVVGIRYSDQIEGLYAHLNQVCVKKGDDIKKGSVIGYVGQNKNAQCPLINGVYDYSHLHFEIKKNNKCIDPLKYLGVKKIKCL